MMYAAFDFKLSKEQVSELLRNYDVHEKLNKTGMEIQSFLSEYTKQGWEQPDYGDGDLLRNEWFPSIKADIFLSHSHADLPMARNLKRLIEGILGLTVFIDNDVWGYCDTLLKQIDDSYCYDEATRTYDYERRNYTTAMVHNLLSIALTKMIDKTECIFFLNTENSNLASDYEDNVTTGSVWINYELWMVDVLQQKRTRKSTGGKSVFDSITEGRRFEKTKYNPPTKRLRELSYSTFKHWLVNSKIEERHPLDCLYTYTVNRGE